MVRLFPYIDRTTVVFFVSQLLPSVSTLGRRFKNLSELCDHSDVRAMVFL